MTDCVLNTISNLVPNKIVTFRNKDALWMTPEIKRIILEKAKIHRRYVKNGRNDADYQSLREITHRCKSAVKEAKYNYYARLGNTLNDPNIGPKKYWYTLIQLLHNRNMPKIPPIRNDRNELVSDVSSKANIFNNFFAKQCSLLDSGSILPPEALRTEQRLDQVIFDDAKILALIRKLDANKAHGWDDVSIRMVKICEESLVRPLMNIFTLSLESGTFPSDWKKANVIPVYKKGDKAIVKNYRPVSLLPTFSKIKIKSVFMIHSTCTLKTSTYSHRLNLAFERGILVYLSCYL